MPITQIPVETPIPNSPRLPVVTPLNVVGDGSAPSPAMLLDFLYAVGIVAPFGPVGCLTLRNAGPNPVFCMINATPTIFPTAAVAAGSVALGVYTPGVFMIQVNESVNLEDVIISSLGCICAAGQTALLESHAIKSGNGLLEG